MFVAIEGMDGVGKTTLAKKVADAYNFEYVEKPLQRVLGVSDEDYDALCNFVWSKDNKNVTLGFFMLGNLLTRYYGDNIVADRHLLSSYYWDGNKDNKEIFKYFCQNDTIPDLTIVLYADVETRLQRMSKRNANDPDLSDSKTINYGYDKMVAFANEINMPYILVNTDNRNEKEVFKYVSEIMSDYLKTKPDIATDFCHKYNEIFYNEKDNQIILNLTSPKKTI